MPIIASAKKKIRSDKRKQARNLKLKISIKRIIKKARRTPETSQLSAVQKALDKAVTSHLIHKNKAARIKSRLAKKIKSI